MLKVAHFPDWIFFTSLVITFVLGLLHFSFPYRFSLFLRVPFSEAFLHQYRPEDSSKTDLFHFLNELQFYAVASLALTTGLFGYTVRATPPDGWLLFLKILLGLLLFFILQAFFHSVVGAVFSQSKEFSLFQFRKSVFRNWGGIGAFPLIIFGFYMPFGNQFLLTGALFLLAGGYITGLSRGGYVLVKEARLQPLHIFLYLCGIEIFPLLILVKALL
ncbi:MAG: DUF4271 domain-containing protein [Bacteroidota bacterium]|nr:DUF4271 domain-containing protein [Bacteroidota bacterium]MDX5447589.1 DUF4271 domain-containing protein [Bacteroidota bacterium]MDX5505107.1 DUF4271 domain-containing protein [Bacteroidota bacterium]